MRPLKWWNSLQAANPPALKAKGVTSIRLRNASKVYKTIEPFQFYSAKVTKAREKFVACDIAILLRQ